MSLAISNLENVRKRGGKVIARCPACAEVGHDEAGEHLVVNADGRFGCVVNPGHSTDAKEHRKRIFALCGDREIKPLAVHPLALGRLGRVSEDRSAGPSLKTGLLGRLGRVNESHSATAPLKSGLLGRLGRLFQTHSGTELTHAGNEDRMIHELNDFKRGVPGVLNTPAVEPHRRLSTCEWAILVRADAEHDPIIIEALRLFDARIVEWSAYDHRTTKPTSARCAPSPGGNVAEPMHQP
jgi:hypothetical protein